MMKQTKHGWVDLSGLARKTNGEISWKESIGQSIEFQYQDVHAYALILDWIKPSRIKIQIPGYTNEHIIYAGHILCGKFGSAVSKCVLDFRYTDGDVVNDTLVITSSYKHNGRKYYQYKCKQDGYVGHMSEYHLIEGQKCPVCTGRVAMRGVNDVATTHPEIAMLFWDKNDSEKYTAHSSRKTYFRCPKCGDRINMIIYNVTNRGLSCRRCGDSFSYPEKFVYNLLQQASSFHSENRLLYNFELQKTFSWSKNIQHDNPKLSGDKVYDFYIPIQNEIIIETHGRQHFEQCSFHTSGSSRTLQEEQENDFVKYSIALQNSISDDRYVVLDCRKSNVEFIKHSIMASNLPLLLDFTEQDIDWDKCNRFAMSSRVYEACELWNSGVHIIKDIAHKMKLNSNTVSRYLRRGEELGIVQDPPKHIKRNKNKTK